MQDYNTDDTMSFLDDDIDPFDIEIPVITSSDTIFSRLGIEFGPFAKGDVMRKARLPKGWRLEAINKISSVIIDDNDAKRAEIIVDGTRKTTLKVLPRFLAGLDTSIIDANIRARFCVWDQRKPTDESVVFEVSYPVPNKVRNIKAYERTIRHHAESQECRKWLDEHYPDWENPLAYWDEEK